MTDTNPEEKNKIGEGSGAHPLPSADEVRKAMAEFEAHHPEPVVVVQPTVVPKPVQPVTPIELDEVTPPIPPAAMDPSVMPVEKQLTPAVSVEIQKPILPANEVVSTPAIPTPTPQSDASGLAPSFVAPKMQPTLMQEKAPVGSLQDQALSAKLPEKKTEAPTPKVAPVIPVTPPTFISPKQVVAPTKTEAPTVPNTTLKSPMDSVLPPMRTLRSDTEESVKEHKTSLISIAAAEENRRTRGESQLLNETFEAKPKRSWTWMIVIAIVLMLLGGIGALVYVFIPPTVPVKEQQPLSTSLISVDEAVAFSIDGESHPTLMQKLTTLRDRTQLSLGLIREMYPDRIDENGAHTRIDIQDLLPLMAPNAPPELVRSLASEYVLGAHVFDGNQAFIILTTGQYQQTYAAMIAWEPAMMNDLSPLFDRRPRPRTANEQLPTASLPAVIKSDFFDAVVENQDSRVLKDAQGNGILLWTFVNQHTLVIATNDRTLREIVSRVQNAPSRKL